MSKAVVTHRIKINPYDKASIDDAVSQLKALQRSFEYTAYLIRHKVAERVMQHADELYNEAWYNDWVHGGKEWGKCPTTLEETEDMSIVIAHGEKAVFIEFGAGVYHNNGLLYSSPNLNGLSLGFVIGMYPPFYRPPYYEGKEYPSHGAGEMWYVKGQGDFTRGTEAQMVLYKAVRYTIPEVEDIVKEVLKR